MYIDRVVLKDIEERVGFETTAGVMIAKDGIALTVTSNTSPAEVVQRVFSLRSLWENGITDEDIDRLVLDAKRQFESQRVMPLEPAMNLHRKGYLIGVDKGVETPWQPCPRCAGQTYHGRPGFERECTYCAGTGQVYKGEPQHA